MYTSEQMQTLCLWADISESAGWWMPFEGVCFVCESPTTQIVDDRGRLHNIFGASMEFRDGWRIHSVHGVTVPGDMIMDRQSITVTRIELEQNTEIRRVMIELFGQEKFLRDSGAKEVHKDEFGTLYRKELLDDEPLVMVKVKNATPESDGQFKDYFLRVPPQMKTAHQAVAWTFGKESTAYVPVFES